MSKLAFSLIELILVILLIGIVTFLVIQIPSFSTKKEISILNLRDILYPNGTIYIFKTNIIITSKDKNQTIPNFIGDDIKVYRYNGKEFYLVNFGYQEDKEILFKYSIRNGIGDAFVLENNEKFYVFKPFSIKEFNSFEKAKEEFLLTKYQPKEGSYY